MNEALPAHEDKALGQETPCPHGQVDHLGCVRQVVQGEANRLRPEGIELSV